MGGVEIFHSVGSVRLRSLGDMSENYLVLGSAICAAISINSNKGIRAAGNTKILSACVSGGDLDEVAHDRTRYRYYGSVGFIKLSLTLTHSHTKTLTH